MERTTKRHDVPLTIDEMIAHPSVLVASSASWLDTAR